MFENKSDIDLVYSLKKDNHTQDCLYELINRHSGIFYDMVNHYTVCYTNSYHREEMLEDIEFLFYKACLRYEEGKGAKFSTFLGNETKWHCLNFYNKNKKFHNLILFFNLFYFILKFHDIIININLFEVKFQY